MIRTGRSGAQKQVLANVAREFGAIVAPDPKKVQDKAARKAAETDGKSLQMLAKWARDLVTQHGSTVTASEGLKAVISKLAPPSN